MTHHNSSKIEDGTNGDIACDSYNKIEEDVRLMKNIGVSLIKYQYHSTMEQV